MHKSIGIVCAFIVLLAVSGIGCCGKGSMPLGVNSQESAAGLTVYTGDNPLITKALSYNVGRYQAVQGFRVVPLRDDFTQLPPRPSPYSIVVETVGDRAIVRIQAENARYVRFHVRYPADEWAPESVAISNAWTGAEDFASFSREFAPGALVITSVPAGDPEAYRANGPVAEISFSRVVSGIHQTESRLPPDPSLDSLNILWYSQYNPTTATYVEEKTYTGTFTYAMDGDPGRLVTKNGLSAGETESESPRTERQRGGAL